MVLDHKIVTTLQATLIHITSFKVQERMVSAVYSGWRSTWRRLMFFLTKN